MAAANKSSVVYRVMSAGEWAEARFLGKYRGTASEKKEGFIHLSSCGQLDATVYRRFRDQENLVAVAFDADKLAKIPEGQLKWAVSKSSDEVFPHFHGPFLPIEEPVCIHAILNYHPARACVVVKPPKRW